MIFFWRKYKFIIELIVIIHSAQQNTTPILQVVLRPQVLLPKRITSSSSAVASSPLSEGQTFDPPPPDFKNEASLVPHVITPDAWSHSIQKFPHEWYNFLFKAANQITSLLSSLDIRSSQCESLESERDQIRRQLRDSNDELIAARALIITLRGHPSPIGHADSRLERLPDIPKFSGKKEDLRSWTTRLHLKLFVNKDRFTGENHDSSMLSADWRGVRSPRYNPMSSHSTRSLCRMYRPSWCCWNVRSGTLTERPPRSVSCVPFVRQIESSMCT